jgi:hypothetical protein
MWATAPLAPVPPPLLLLLDPPPLEPVLLELLELGLTHVSPCGTHPSGQGVGAHPATWRNGNPSTAELHREDHTCPGVG